MCLDLIGRCCYVLFCWRVLTYHWLRQFQLACLVLQLVDAVIFDFLVCSALPLVDVVMFSFAGDSSSRLVCAQRGYPEIPNCNSSSISLPTRQRPIASYPQKLVDHLRAAGRGKTQRNIPGIIGTLGKDWRKQHVQYTSRPSGSILTR